MNRLSSTTGLCRGISLSLPAGMRSSGRKGLWDWVGRCGNSIHQRDLYHLIFEWTRNTHWTSPPPHHCYHTHGQGMMFTVPCGWSQLTWQEEFRACGQHVSPSALELLKDSPNIISLVASTFLCPFISIHIHMIEALQTAVFSLPLVPSTLLPDACLSGNQIPFEHTFPWRSFWDVWPFVPTAWR